MPDEERLLELLRRAREEGPAARDAAFVELNRLLRPLVFRYYTKRGFSEGEAEDLTQDALLRVFHGLEGFRGESPFLGWLFEILANVYRNELRRRHSAKRSGTAISLDAMTEAAAEDSGSSRWEPTVAGPDALERLVAREGQARFRQLLAGLPPQMRRVCLLRYVQQWRYREVADIMGISIDTVKSHLHEARKRIADQLGGPER